jgi:hypothetical protein
MEFFSKNNAAFFYITNNICSLASGIVGYLNKKQQKEITVLSVYVADHKCIDEYKVL